VSKESFCAIIVMFDSFDKNKHSQFLFVTNLRLARRINLLWEI